MDKTTKFILGLIAVALIGINIQMWNGKTGLIKPAYAKTGDIHFIACYTGLGRTKESMLASTGMAWWGKCGH